MDWFQRGKLCQITILGFIITVQNHCLVKVVMIQRRNVLSNREATFYTSSSKSIHSMLSEHPSLDLFDILLCAVEMRTQNPWWNPEESQTCMHANTPYCFPIMDNTYQPTINGLCLTFINTHFFSPRITSRGKTLPPWSIRVLELKLILQILQTWLHRVPWSVHQQTWVQ